MLAKGLGLLEPAEESVSWTSPTRWSIDYLAPPSAQPQVLTTPYKGWDEKKNICRYFSSNMAVTRSAKQ